MIPFERASYRAQVLRSRRLAWAALAQYAVHVTDLRFINHAENTTFRAITTRGQSLLVRIHRAGYHTRPALDEELAWLERLSKNRAVLAPVPIRSRAGTLLVEATAPGFSAPRQCDVLRWVHGRFLRRSTRPEHLRQLGELIGRLHVGSRGQPVIHRNYWDASGLLGDNPTLGRIDAAPLNPSQRRLLEGGRRQLLRELQRFERRFPERLGLIHADLHFGNFLSTANGLAAIDFDDCGRGFLAYDLTIPLAALENRRDRGWFADIGPFRDALFDGYARHCSFDSHDETLTLRLLSVRRMCMLGWLVSRSDNPLLEQLVPKAVAELTNHFRALK